MTESTLQTEAPRDRISASPAVGDLPLFVEHDVPAAMRDGVVLRADIVRPAGEGRWPVILCRTPYGKQMPIGALVFDMLAFARKGYVCITQDVRARGTSDGGPEFTPFAHEADDGFDSVAWAASLPYADGDVYMAGMSYLGLTQWTAAMQQAPALRAIAPAASPAHPLRSMGFQGGVFELAAMASWFFGVSAETLMKRHREDPQRLMQALRGLVGDMMRLEHGGLAELPLDTFPPIARHGIGERFFEMMSRDLSTPLLKGQASSTEYEKVEVPALIHVGWFDFFIQSSIDQYIAMKAQAATPEAREGTRLIVGPWTHSNFQGQFAGERNFGRMGTMAGVNPGGLTGETIAFIEQTRGKSEAKPAPVKIFVMGTNVWRDEQEWPLARTQQTPWYLSSAGHANGAAGDGRIGPDPQPSPADTFEYDPANPVPTWGGSNLGHTELSGPRDQRPIEGRADMLVYTSEPLDAPLEVTGTPIVELWVATDAPDTDFVAQLVDVEPDGTCWKITDGILRLRYRDDPLGTPASEPAESGKPYLMRIELMPTSMVFRKGHRLRLDVTSSSFPRWARNLNIWDDTGATIDQARVARNTVLHGGEHLSRIILPIIPSPV